MKKVIEILILFLLAMIPLLMASYTVKKKNQSRLAWFTNIVRSMMMSPEHFMDLWQLVMLNPFRNNLRRKGKRSGYVAYFNMMSMPDPNAVVKGVLNMSGDNKADTVATGRQMVHDWIGNTDVTVPVATTDAATTAIDNYESAHGSDIKPFYIEMIRQLNLVAREFNDYANLPANRARAISILQNAGLHVQGKGGSHESVWGVRNSVVSGEMLITFPTLTGCSYECWYSSDGINYARIQSGTLNHNSLGGLTPGKSAWFKYQHIVGNTGQGISDPLERIVQ